MDKTEARALLAEHMRDLRQKSYGELCRYLGSRNADTIYAIAPSGVKYQIEVQAIWDEKPYGDLRIIVSIDDGDLRAFAPISDDFIIIPDGGFVGE